MVGVVYAQTLVYIGALSGAAHGNWNLVGSDEMFNDPSVFDDRGLCLLQRGSVPRVHNAGKDTDLTDASNIVMRGGHVRSLARVPSYLLSSVHTRSSNGTPAEFLPPIIFVKTHKTGSTTIANILFRLGEARQRRFMLGCSQAGCDGHLGWPGPFPGQEAERFWGPPRNQFDIICNHAVYDDKRMRSYTTSSPRGPFLFTVLREPLSQIRSAFEYFKPHVTDWASRILAMEAMVPDSSKDAARFRNSQARDLGWYHQAGDASLDSQDELVDEWLASLGRNFSLVVLTEHFDEGLVLLSRKFGVEIEELKYLKVEPAPVPSRLPLTAQKRYVPPAASEAAKILQLSNIDVRLYAHFNRTFWQQWESAGGSAALGADLDKLRAANDALALACSKVSTVETQEAMAEALSSEPRSREHGVPTDALCPWRFQANDLDYPLKLMNSPLQQQLRM